MRNSKVRLYDEVKAKEMNIEIDGYSFLCIFGEHINGGFLAIPNHNICVELSEAYDFAYNTDNIYMAMSHLSKSPDYKLSLNDISAIADTIAEHIRKTGY